MPLNLFKPFFCLCKLGRSTYNHSLILIKSILLYIYDIKRGQVLCDLQLTTVNLKSKEKKEMKIKKIFENI